MSTEKSFNLFVYGTLKNPSVFQAVLGKRLVTDPRKAGAPDTVLARGAVLNGYKTISLDNTYLYAVPDQHGRIQGYIVSPLDQECLEALKKYEGRNYHRQKVRVATGDGREQAIAFLGNLKQLEHSFGYAFHDHFKQEILLHKKIDAALLETEKNRFQTAEPVIRRAVGELHGSIIRDLVRRHFEAAGISDYAIRQSLVDAPLPDFTRIRKDPEANALAANYLSLVVRQVIFNQMEERIHHEFHYELVKMTLSEDFYDRTISSLVTLQILNTRDELLDILVGDCLTDLSFANHHLMDFIRWAIVAADAVYDPRTVGAYLKFIRNHMGRGPHKKTPLGAELEFSNIGHDVIRDPQGQTMRDRVYDGFVYFTDFGLDALTWKLGGHIDDHYVKSSHDQRRGFFEIAPGNLSIQENLSKPLTGDPWLLNQFIHETQRFYRIAPHSVHISMQLRSSHHRPVRDKPPPLNALKCLFALAGDPARQSSGQLVINRLVSDEIIRNQDDGTSMMFTNISRRHSEGADESYAAVRTAHEQGRYVQQFKFLRLSKNLNYELITMALKGLQLSLAPGSFLTPWQYETSRTHRKRFEELVAWGAAPQALSNEQIEGFLGTVYDGLMREHRGKPAHNTAYISWSISQLRYLLARFNALLTPPH